MRTLIKQINIPVFKTAIRLPSGGDPAKQPTHQFVSVFVEYLDFEILREWNRIEYSPKGKLDAFDRKEAEDFCKKMASVMTEGEVVADVGIDTGTGTDRTGVQTVQPVNAGAADGK